MDSAMVCRCCLARPPDKDLKLSYQRLGKNEVYLDMLKECFEIHMLTGECEGDSGICDVCVGRLRDANDFKMQVQQCQRDFASCKDILVKGEKVKVKEEIADGDDDNGIYFLPLKDELSEYDELKHDSSDDDKNLAEMLFDGVGLKKKLAKKKRLLLDKSGESNNTHLRAECEFTSGRGHSGAARGILEQWRGILD